MAKFNSKDSVFQITDTGSTLRNLSAYIDEIDGIPGERELNEVTALGDSGRKNVGGLENVVITLAGHFDSTATTGPDAVLGPLRTDDTARAWDYGPYGTTGGYTKYSGTMKVRIYQIMSRVGEVVRWRAEIAVDGAVTRGTY